jgi:hypothetical protein
LSLPQRDAPAVDEALVQVVAQDVRRAEDQPAAPPQLGPRVGQVLTCRVPRGAPYCTARPSGHARAEAGTYACTARAVLRSVRSGYVHRTCTVPLRGTVHRTCTAPYVHRSVRAPLRACTAPCVHRSVRTAPYVHRTAPEVLYTVRAVRAALRLWCKRGRRASGQAALVRAWWPERLRRRATRRATRSAWAASGQAALRLGCAQHAGGAGTVAPGRTCQLRRSPVSIMASVSGLRPTLWQHAPICCCTSGRVGAMKTTVPVGNQRRKLCMTTEAISVLPAVQHTVRATHGTPEAGTRTACVQCVGAGDRQPSASGTYNTQEAGTRSPCAQYVSAQRLAHARRQRDESVLEEGGVAHALLVRAVAVLRRARELPRRRRDAGLWRRTAAAAACHRRLGRRVLLVRPSILQTVKHRSRGRRQVEDAAGARQAGC